MNRHTHPITQVHMNQRCDAVIIYYADKRFRYFTIYTKIDNSTDFEQVERELGHAELWPKILTEKQINLMLLGMDPRKHHAPCKATVEDT